MPRAPQVVRITDDFLSKSLEKAVAIRRLERGFPKSSRVLM